MIAKTGNSAPTVEDSLEMPVLKDLYTTYGKTFHFWEIDLGQ
jgi:hypothetical protein